MKLLTIAIPTFNRAAKALAQTEKLLQHIHDASASDDVSLILCDNASTDDTQRRVEAVLTDSGQTYYRNATNIGIIGNYWQCLALSESSFTWVVGDDDDIDDACLGQILSTLRVHTNLEAFFLNPRQYDNQRRSYTNQTYYPLGYQGYFEGVEDMKELLSELHFSSFLWMTGSVLRTATAKRALSYAGSRSNLALTLFVSLFCACQGPWIVASKTTLTMVCGNNSWSHIYARRVYGIDIPAALRRLRSLGFDFMNTPEFRDLYRKRWIAIIGDVRRRNIKTFIDIWNA